MFLPYDLMSISINHCGHHFVFVVKALIQKSLKMACIILQLQWNLNKCMLKHTLKLATSLSAKNGNN